MQIREEEEPHRRLSLPRDSVRAVYVRLFSTRFPVKMPVTPKHYGAAATRAGATHCEKSKYAQSMARKRIAK